MNNPVSFELALLLVENKYDISTDSLYVNNSLIYANGRKCNWNLEEDYDEIPEPVSAPTIADVVMWLYEKHGIWIMVNNWKEHVLDDDDNILEKTHLFTWFITGEAEERTFNSPIEAYEAGIEYILTKLI
jgi:hypothetical protein